MKIISKIWPRSGLDNTRVGLNQILHKADAVLIHSSQIQIFQKNEIFQKNDSISPGKALEWRIIKRRQVDKGIFVITGPSSSYTANPWSVLLYWDGGHWRSWHNSGGPTVRHEECSPSERPITTEQVDNGRSTLAVGSWKESDTLFCYQFIICTNISALLLTLTRYGYHKFPTGLGWTK